MLGSEANTRGTSNGQQYHRLNSSFSGFQRLISNFRNGERFFVTNDGHFSFGPGTLDVADCIMLFAGATKPMVVRLSCGEYRLLGNAYVHGIMGGEAWPDGEQGSLTTCYIASSSQEISDNWPYYTLLITRNKKPMNGGYHCV